jgi:hypothetical protein
MFSAETISFTATNSKFGVSNITLSAALPIRPIPLIAIFFSFFGFN